MTAMTASISKTDLRVRDLMTPSVINVHSQDTVAMAYELMLNHRFRHLAVLDRDGDLVGLLTHRDLLRHSLIERAELPLSLQHTVMQRILVEEVMTSEVETIEAGQPLEEAAQIMFENKYGCLPVVEGSRVVGILTESDFVRFFALAGRLQSALMPVEPDEPSTGTLAAKLRYS
jgi:CBS domain-containing membrane protein